MIPDEKTPVDVEKSGTHEKPIEMSFEEAFELTGHGKFNHIVLFTSGLIMLNVSMESLGVSYIITAAECDLGLTSVNKGLVTSAAFIGIIATSFLWGYLGDKYGRRAVMLPAMVCSTFVSVASSFSYNFWMLFILRILTGCLVSASSATVYAYLGEMHINSRRGAAIAWGSAFISISFIILPGLAWIIIPGEWSFSVGFMTIVPWRVFIWSWCVPALIAAAILLKLPESPRYLLSAKGSDLALPVLAKMYAFNHGGVAADYPVQKISESSKVAGIASAMKNIALMFKPPLLRCVFISHVSVFAVFMLSSGLYVWVPELLNSLLSNTGEQSNTICQIVEKKLTYIREILLSDNKSSCKADVEVAVFPISMSMGAVFAITYLAIGFFINRVGKKRLYSIILFICGVATIAAVFVPQGGIAVALLILSLCSGCAASILAAISVDVFPTCLRAMALCIMYMVGRSGAAVGSYVLGATLESHCVPVFIFLGVFTSGSTLLMLLWPNPQKVREEMERKGLTY